MAAIMPMLTIASAAMSAVGAISQGEAQAAQAKSQAQAQEYNAQVARNNATMANDQANAQEEQQRRHFAMVQGQARAAAAQSGAGFDGSNNDILNQNSLMNELDALTIRYDGQNKANGLIAQAQQDEYQAKASRMNAGSAITGGYLNAGASILSGATNYTMASNGLGPYAKGK